MMKIIQLTQGWVVWVDDCDYERLSGYKWYVHSCKQRKYAARGQWCGDGVTKIVYMHREIMNAQPGQEVDHIWGESSPGIIHNWRDNLRLCTPTQNRQGFQRKKKGASSQFRGVHRRKDSQKWQAQIKVKGYMRRLGLFDNEEDAAHAYDVAAKRFFGEFASPNFS